MLGAIPWVVDQFRALAQNWRRVRVLVHKDAGGVPVVDLATGIPVVCIKVTNLSPQREVEITHVWYQGEPQIHLLGSRLPARLRLDETWEECIPTEKVAHIPEVERAGRVRLSSGKTIRSRQNRNVPPVGYVARPRDR
jgi:hypothetical protein